MRKQYSLNVIFKINIVNAMYCFSYLNYFRILRMQDLGVKQIDDNHVKLA